MSRTCVCTRSALEMFFPTNHMHASQFSMRALMFSWPCTLMLDMNWPRTIIRITSFPIILVRIYTNLSLISTDRDFFPQNNTEWDHFPHFFQPNFNHKEATNSNAEKILLFVSCMLFPFQLSSAKNIGSTTNSLFPPNRFVLWKNVMCTADRKM